MHARAALLVLALGSAPSPALAQADCGLIRNSDKRRACYAERDRRPGECSLIRDGDERRFCRSRSDRR